MSSILSPQWVHMPSWSCPWDTSYPTGSALQINLLLVPEAEFPQECIFIKTSASAYMSTSPVYSVIVSVFMLPAFPPLIYGLIVISPLCRFPPPGNMEQAAVLGVFSFHPACWLVHPSAICSDLCEEGQWQWHASAADHCPWYQILMKLCFFPAGMLLKAVKFPQQ